MILRSVLSTYDGTKYLSSTYNTIQISRDEMIIFFMRILMAQEIIVKSEEKWHILILVVIRVKPTYLSSI